MISELEVLDMLKKVIEEQLNDYLEDLPEIDEKNVIIDFPEIDLMPKNTMIYLQPNYSEYENLSVVSDNSNFVISVFFICKKDKQENLTKKIYGYMNSFYKLMRTNMSLDGQVDFVDITDSDYYPAVEGNKNVKAIEISITVRFTKDY